MKRLLFGIFAHPDDEAFGPSASLMQAVDSGVELHLVCLTDGQAGTNTDGHEQLGKIRLQEWHNAATAIGASAVYPLHYKDGGLCHQLYSEIGDTLEGLVVNTCTAIDEPVELSFVTMDQNGITGHLDHIAASYLTTKLFYCFTQQPPKNAQITEIAYYCLSDQQAPSDGQWPTYYTPMGRPASYINRRIDVRSLLPRKFEVMKLHHTQRQDATQIMSQGEEALAIDNFHVVKA